MRVAVNGGGHLEQVARKRLGHAQLIPLTDNAALADALQRGEVDAVVSEELEARLWAAGQFARLAPFTRDRKAYAVPRPAAGLLRQVDDWLAAREADGWLNQQRRHWFGAPAVWSQQQAAFEALVAAMDLRLQLMPLVAAVKRRDGLPIDDPAQEARVLAYVRPAAADAGLNADAVAAVFQLQITAAKAVEHAAPSSAPAPDVALADVRGAVAAASDQVISELARCRPWLSAPRHGADLDKAVHVGLTAPGVPVRLEENLIAALRRIR